MGAFVKTVDNNLINNNNMKKILFMVFLAVLTFGVNAQVNFMGIPVDGSAKEMIQKLKDKGFRETIGKYENEGKQFPVLEGSFNGKSVLLWVITNHKKVYRIMVVDQNGYEEASIITQFNVLFNQFFNNKKYIHIDGEEIPSDEDVSYEMSIHNKIYQAVFRQVVFGNTESENMVWFMVKKIYGEYFIVIYYDNEVNAPNGEDL
jgi:hypothetical protein